MNAKKALERQFLAKAAALYPNFPPGSIIDAERPDFLTSSDSRITGIEVVNYVRGQHSGGSDHRRNEVLWQQITDEARRKFESNNPDPLMVHFSWYSNRYPRKAEVPAIAANVAEVVERHVPKTIFARTQISGDDFIHTLAHTYLDSIHVTKVRNARQTIWAPIGAGFISVSAPELQGISTSKGYKVRQYLQKCDEVWLLIVADGRYTSSTGELLEEEARRVESPTLFQEVLFYDRPNKMILSLAG